LSVDTTFSCVTTAITITTGTAPSHSIALALAVLHPSHLTEEDS
jgi:hypothetical protein